MSSIVRFIACILPLVPLAAVAQELPAGTLNKLKAAAVFVKVATRDGGQTGSGVLIEKNRRAGYVVTNAHVVEDREAPARSVQCVFHSGTPDEFAVPAIPVAFEPDRDLAVLFVMHDKLPAALTLSKRAEIRETLSVFVFGFPFGDALATSQRSPATTITRGTISSIRRDDFDRLAVIQIDGGINPGNSGGPIVDSQGALVGISTAKVEGTEIGLAIPADRLRDSLMGRVQAIQFLKRGQNGDRLEFEVRAYLSDPMDRIRQVSLHAVQATRVNQAPQPKSDGSWPAVAPGMRSHPLVIDAGVATGTVHLSADPDKQTKYVFQIRCTRGDRQSDYCPPSLITLLGGEYQLETADDISTDVKAASSVRRVDVPKIVVPKIAPPTLAGPRVVKKVPGTIRDVQLAAGGRYIVSSLSDRSELAVFDVSRAEFIGSVVVPEASMIATGKEFLVALDLFENEIHVYSLELLERVRVARCPIKGVIKGMALGSASSGPLLIHWAEGVQLAAPAYFTLLDLNTLQPQSLVSLDETIDDTPQSTLALDKPEFTLGHHQKREPIRMRAAADGSTFGIWHDGNDARLEYFAITDRKGVAMSRPISVGHVLPDTDGQGFCTARGYFDRELQRVGQSRFSVPSCHPQYLVQVPYAAGGQDRPEWNRVEIVDRDGMRVVATLPQLVELDGVVLGGDPGDPLTAEKRVICIPQARVLVTIPLGGDQFVLRPLSVAEFDNIVTAEPEESPQIVMRQWSDRTGRYRIRAEFVAIELDKVKLRNEEGEIILVPLDKLSDDDISYLKGRK